MSFIMWILFIIGVVAMLVCGFLLLLYFSPFKACVEYSHGRWNTLQGFWIHPVVLSWSYAPGGDGFRFVILSRFTIPRTAEDDGEGNKQERRTTEAHMDSPSMHNVESHAEQPPHTEQKIPTHFSAQRNGEGEKTNRDENRGSVVGREEASHMAEEPEERNQDEVSAHRPPQGPDREQSDDSLLNSGSNEDERIDRPPHEHASALEDSGSKDADDVEGSAETAQQQEEAAHGVETDQEHLHDKEREGNNKKKSKCGRWYIVRHSSAGEYLLAIAQQPDTRAQLLRWIIASVASGIGILGFGHFYLRVCGRCGGPDTTGMMAGAMGALQHACGMYHLRRFNIEYIPDFETTDISISASMSLSTSLFQMTRPVLVMVWKFPYRLVFFTILQFIEEKREACMEEESDT